MKTIATPHQPSRTLYRVALALESIKPGFIRMLVAVHVTDESSFAEGVWWMAVME